MVALSVSTSAITSPELTLSPTFLCHFAITPSVMVSLILGIRTTSAILNFFEFRYKSVKMLVMYERIILLSVYVFVQFVNLRIRRIFCKLNSISYYLFHLCVYFLKPFFVSIFLFGNGIFNGYNRVSAFVRLQFFFCTVLCRV